MLVKKHVMTIQILGMYIVQASRNLEYLLDINNNKIAISKITHISITFLFILNLDFLFSEKEI